jgi:hypothetical protein
VLAPGFDPVTVTGDRLRTLANARLGADKVKRDLLRAFTPVNVGDILVLI